MEENNQNEQQKSTVKKVSIKDIKKEKKDELVDRVMNIILQIK